MVADGRQAQAISSLSGVSPIQGWDRFRDDSREAVLARLVSSTPVRGVITGASGNAAGAAGASNNTAGGNLPTPAGLVRAQVLQAKSAGEALVDISGRAFLINTRQQLTPGTTVMLRILDDSTYQQAEALGATTVRVRPGDLRAAAAQPGSGLGPATLDDPYATAGTGDAAGIRAMRGVTPTPMPSLAQLATENGDAKVQLSGSARLLLALANESASGNVQRGLPAPAALMLDPQADTQTLSQRIQQAVEHSGLFYEAHLQEWREGRRSLDSLRAEPQAELSPGPTSAKNDEAKHVQPDPTQEPDTPEQSATKGLMAALRAIPDDVKPLVQDQIALLESGRLAMQGAWGERPFTLEVEPDESRAAFDADLPMAWRVRLAIDTPNLGKLQLEVALSGTTTQVTVRPDTRTLRGQRLQEVQTLLRNGSVELQQALDARGLAMTNLNVTTASPLAPLNASAAPPANTANKPTKPVTPPQS